MNNSHNNNKCKQTFSDDMFYIISEYSININNISLLNKQIRDITHNYRVFNAGKLTIDFLNKKGKLIRKITNYYNQFNLSIVPNLTYLEMGNDFNQKITLPNSLAYLKMGFRFDQPITPTWLPNSLTNLVIGYDFNQQITLPNSLIYLLEEYKNYIIKNN